MYTKTIVRKKTYFDSVTLMSLTAKIKKAPGVCKVVISMGTEMNIDILKNNGLYEDALNDVTPDDLIISLVTEDEEKYNEIFDSINKGLTKKVESGKASELKYSTIDGVCKDKEMNMAVISVPGQYAAYQAMKALRNNLNVMLFSDNVSYEDELDLKTYAKEKGLLVMGPDCGTAIINNKGLCFANSIRKGSIGIVAASGTGLQEVCVNIDRFGGGISQAIGVGGRDLSEKIGGIMIIEGLKRLCEDTETKVIVIISKTPHPTVEEKVLNLLENVTKPVVICYIDNEKLHNDKHNYAYHLDECAKMACKLDGSYIETIEDKEKTKKNFKFVNTQKYIRGLYCGGTICSEAVSIARKQVKLQSNVSKRVEEKMHDSFSSIGNTFVDLGDDVFTVGKPHPMIEPSIRLDRIIQEASDPTVKVILMDFEIGYGSSLDPVGVTLPAIIEGRQIAASQGRDVAFVGYVQGSASDKQGKDAQNKMLEDNGVIIASTNAIAVNLALDILKGE